MKVLTVIKRVEDPEIKVKIKGDGSGIETDQMKYVVNPFDEIAVEEALRVRDAHSGELIVACVGPKDATQQIRTALAMGANRGVHVVADKNLDPHNEVKALQKVVEKESPDLIILGKQSVDDDLGQVGALLAQQLGWSQISFTSKEESLEGPEEKGKQTALNIADGSLQALREVDGGVEVLKAKLPAVVTTELRLNVPRYASLPGIMKAKKKPIEELAAKDLLGDTSSIIKVIGMEAPPSRAAGIKVENIGELVEKLKNEAKVI